MASETLTIDGTTTDLPHEPSADASGLKGSRSDEPSHTTIQEFSLEAICMESGLQVRAKTDERRVKDYAAQMENGTVFPPVVIFNDGETHWLGDGKHRIKAAEQNGYLTIRAEVRYGTQRDAFLYGLQVNAAHGLALTNAEKRAAVDLMLQDPEWGTWSDREIARQCGATHPSVSRRRQSVTGKFYQLPQIRKYKRGNKTTEMDTSNIGKGSSPTDRSGVRLDASSTGENDQTAEASAPNEMEEPLQPGHLASSASNLQSQCHYDWGIKAVPHNDDESLAEHQEAAVHNKSADLEPEGSNHGGQPELKDASSDELPELQDDQAPVPALRSLLDKFEGGLGDFRVQYACDDPDAQDTLLSLEALPTTAEPLDPAAVVQAFVKRRCLPSSDPVSHQDLMGSITTWMDNQNLPRLNESEMIRELHRMGFYDSNVIVRNKAKANEGWKWQGFQLLPSDAPDNEGDPFSSPQP